MAWAGVSLVMACGPRVSASTSGGEGPATTSTASTGLATDSIGATSTSTGTTGESTPTTDGGNDDDSDQMCHWSEGNKDLGADGICDRVENPDANRGDCDPWNDDCPGGEKCFNIAYDPACGAIAPRARQMYEPCTVLEQGRYDDCDRGLVCYGDICVGVCECGLEFEHCDDPSTRCAAGGVNPCLRPCDPLMPECPHGFYCSGGPAGFLCHGGDEDRDCFGAGDCADGFECLQVNVDQWGPGVHSGLRVPDCTTRDRGCCAELCSLSAGVCSDPNMICSPMGTLPEWEGCTFDAGVCLLPE